MASFNYARSRSTAERLIAKFGQSATLRRTTPGNGPSYNPGTVTTDYACTVKVGSYALSLQDGTLIKADDKKVMLSTAGLSVVPTTSDQLIINGDLHTIVTVMPTDGAGSAVMYTCQARR